jgi:hypothetical protein
MPTTTKGTSWSDLLPDADLLKQWQGVEEGLRRRRQIGWVGAFIAAAVQLFVSIHDSQMLAAWSNVQWAAVATGWYLVLPLTAGVLFVILYRWLGFWLHESEQSFRYTCSIEPFVPHPGDAKTENDPKLDWLNFDLSKFMDERIGRLRFAKEPASDGPDASSHIHVRGTYLIREDSHGQQQLAVQTFVRIGGASKPETLGHLVEFPLKAGAVDINEYWIVLERVYFSAASEIYRQIEEDVKGKIALLPTAWFKAVALFYEAEDYARSGTLDAISEARNLYQQCFRMIDVRQRPNPDPGPRLLLHRYHVALQAHLSAWRRSFARIRPAFARRDVLCARAELGYANTLLQASQLASMAGQNAVAIFPVPPVVQRALTRLAELPADVPDLRSTLFRGHVLMAWAQQLQFAPDAAERSLEAARQVPPSPGEPMARPESDARYNFVKGFSTNYLPQRIESLVRAQELAPRDETTAFVVAYTKEYLWRARPDFRLDGAKGVLDLYETLTTTNPGLVAAWANRGYLQWLLVGQDDTEKQLTDCRATFEDGRRYKDIKQETFVAELDYGLARVAAERGKFDEAYKHCAELAASWSSTNLSFRDYYFKLISPETIQRFETYQKRVQSAHQAGKGSGEWRIGNAVMAFVENDCGEAFYAFYRRSGRQDYYDKAEAAFSHAIALDADYSLPYLNRADLRRSEPEKARQDLERCLMIKPEWIDARQRLFSLLTDTATGHLAERRTKLAQIEAGGQEGDDLKKQQAEADDLAELAAKADRDALQILRQLLPQPWLWTRAGFNWALLQNQNSEQEESWRRDISEVEALSLFLFAEAMLRRPATEGRPDENPAALIDLLRSLLYRDRHETMMALRDASMTAKLAYEVNKALSRNVQDWMTEDPANQEVLRYRWIQERTPIPALCVRRSIESPAIPPAALLETASFLRSADGAAAFRRQADQARTLAEDAFQLAIRTPDPSSWKEVAGAAESLGRWDDVKTIWDRAVQALKPGDAGWQDAMVGSAAGRWMTGSREDVPDLLDSVARQDPQVGLWRTDFVKRIASADASPRDRHRLRTWLGHQYATGTPAAREDAQQAILALAGANPARPDELPAQTSPLQPVKPIVLATAVGLWVGGDGEKHIPTITRMRKALEEQFGIVFPGVYVTDDIKLLPKSYSLLIEGALVDVGTADPDLMYHPNDPNPGTELTRVFNPFNGTHSAVAMQRPQTGTPKGFWDHRDYIAQHLRYVLAANAVRFFGVQEMDTLLGQARWPARAAALREDPAASRDLLAVLQGLLREQVPITDLAAIIATFDAGPTGDVIAIIEAVRRRLRVFPLLQTISRHLTLPEKLRDLVRADLPGGPGRVPFLLSGRTRSALLQWLRDARNEQPDLAAAVIVDDERLRPLLARVLSVPVFARRELPRPQPVAAGVGEAA